jgi:hypothetical protein
MSGRKATQSIFPLLIDQAFAPHEPLDPDLHSAYNAAASCAFLTWDVYIELLQALGALGSVPQESLSSALAIVPALGPALDKLATLRRHREKFRSTVDRAAQPLLDARKGLGSLGSGGLPTEHQRALQAADDLYSAIWQAADSEEWGRKRFTPRACLDVRAIVQHAQAVYCRLGGMVIRDAYFLVWDIQKEAVAAQKDRNAMRLIQEAAPNNKDVTATHWLTVVEAARIAGCNSGVISNAASAGFLKSNGERGRKRRIDAADLSRWQLRRAERREPTESNAAVEKKLKEGGTR